MYRLFLIITVVIATACTSEPEIQSKYHGFSNETWEQNSPVEFVFEISDTSKTYTLDCKLRYNEGFTFRSLNLNVSLLSPSGSSRFSGLNIDLKNDDGTYKGDKEEDYLQIIVPVFNKLRFNEEGEWVLNVMHKMPIDINRGIHALIFEMRPVTQ